MRSFLNFFCLQNFSKSNKRTPTFIPESRVTFCDLYHCNYVHFVFSNYFSFKSAKKNPTSEFLWPPLPPTSYNIVFLMTPPPLKRSDVFYGWPLKVILYRFYLLDNLKTLQVLVGTSYWLLELHLGGQHFINGWGFFYVTYIRVPTWLLLEAPQGAHFPLIFSAVSLN